MTSLLSIDGPLKILLVEDNPGDARLVEAHLQEALGGEFELYRASRLEKGERLLREQSPDLVLLDLDLPDSSGLATVRRFQEACGEEPVVVLTGRDDEATALQALRQGAQEYLTKDRMTPEALGRVVRHSLERHRTARKLDRAREARDRLAAILEASPDFVGLADPDGRIRWVNGPGRELIGAALDEELAGEPIENIHPDWARDIVRLEGIPTAMEEGVWQGETALLTREDEEIPVSQLILAHRDRDGEVEYLSTLMRDVSEARYREGELRRSRERLQRVLETMVEGICITDGDGTVVYANEGAERILETPASEMVDRGISDEVLSGGRWRRHDPGGTARKTEEFAVHRALTSGEPVHGIEHVLRRPDRDPKVISVNAAPLAGREGEVEGAVLSLRDVTRQREAEEELERKALHDRLTGLPNRTLFFDRLEQAVARASRGQARFTVLFVDLDSFKAVNDSLGHGTGDRVLERVSERIRDCFREEDTVARVGGDEFTVLLEGVDDRASIRRAVERLTEALDPPHRIQGESFHIPASVGIAVGEGNEDPREIVRRADHAMYRAKERGGAAYHFFDSGDDTGDSRRDRRKARLQEGIRRGEFTLHYQPVLELEEDVVRGVEALARWDHPDRGLLMPGEFIRTAEETGLILDLGRELIVRACRDASRWQGDGPLPLFLNLSARQLGWDELVPLIRDTLEETGFPAGLLRFEVTERFLARTSGPVSALRELGVDLFIDDFGVGRSSLADLRDLPVDGLKVDPSFAAGLGQGTTDEALVRTILALGEALDIPVVAEGIERQEQKRILLDLGCRLGQGFLFADPMASAQLEGWLRQRRSPEETRA